MIEIKWKGDRLTLPLTVETTISTLRALVCSHTGIDPSTLRLLGLRKGTADDTRVAECGARKIVVMGRSLNEVNGLNEDIAANVKRKNDDEEDDENDDMVVVEEEKEMVGNRDGNVVKDNSDDNRNSHVFPVAPGREGIPFNMFGGPQAFPYRPLNQNNNTTNFGYNYNGSDNNNNNNILGGSATGSHGNMNNMNASYDGQVGLDGLAAAVSSLERIEPDESHAVASRALAPESISDALAQAKSSFRGLLVVVIDDHDDHDDDNSSNDNNNNNDNNDSDDIDDINGNACGLGYDRMGNSRSDAIARSRWLWNVALKEGPVADFVAENFIVWAGHVPRDRCGGKTENANEEADNDIVNNNDDGGDKDNAKCSNPPSDGDNDNETKEETARDIALGDLRRGVNCRSFPYTLMVGNIGTMTVLDVTQGADVTRGGIDSLFGHFLTIHDTHGPLMQTAAAVVAASDQRTSLRDEQEAEFEKAMDADKRRMSQLSSSSTSPPPVPENGIAQENMMGVNEENGNDNGNTSSKNNDMMLEAIAASRESALESMPEEPAPGAGSASIALRLLSGDVVRRRFDAKVTSVGDLIDFALLHCDPSISEITLVSNFPRVIYASSDRDTSEKSIEEAGLCPSAKLFVQLVDQDD